MPMTVALRLKSHSIIYGVHYTFPKSESNYQAINRYYLSGYHRKTPLLYIEELKGIQVQIHAKLKQ